MSGEYNLRKNIFTEFSWNSVVFKLKFSLTVDQQVSVFSNYIAVLGVTGIGCKVLYRSMVSWYIQIL